MPSSSLEPGSKVSSFISSFKPLLAALAIIVGLEAAVALIWKPDVIQRSNYFSWMYGSEDPFHKFLIYTKMRELLTADAEVVGVGDSSGFNGIRPKIVMEDIPNLSYFSMNNVANTGFDGYYDFAKFALAHNPRLKAIVLYITLNNVPNNYIVGGDAGGLGAEKIHEAYVGPWSFIALPSFVLRPVVTNVAYSMFGYLVPLRKGLTANVDAQNMMQSAESERGWWAEHDGRRIGSKNDQFFEQLCGKDDVFSRTRADWSSPNGNFLPLVVFKKFAALAKSHDKKLLIVFHPHPCATISSDTQQLLAETLDQVKSEYPNVQVFPERIFEHWPRQIFTGADHLYVGYEYYSSRRLARFLAAALGLPAKEAEQIRLPHSSISVPSEKPVWQNAGFKEGWLLEGVTASREGSMWKLTESDRNVRHYMETRLPGLVPNRYYLIALTYKPIGNRMVNLILRDNVREGLTWCDPQSLDAARRADFYDGSVVPEADGFFTCWGIIRLEQDVGFIGLDFLPHGGGFPYAGDGQSGILVKDFRVYARSSPDVVADTGPRH
jgi:hypothetical protein